MMAVGFAVGRNMHKLRLPVILDESARQAMSHRFAALEQIAETDRLRDRPIIEKERDTFPRWQAAKIRHARIHLAAADIHPILLAYRAHPMGLARRENRKDDTLLSERFQRLDIRRRFSQPHAFRPPPKAMLEIFDTPDDLRAFIPA